MRFTNLLLYQRLLRLSLGLVLMVMGWWWSGAGTLSWTVPLRVVALYPLLTGVLGWCPVNSLLLDRADPDE